MEALDIFFYDGKGLVKLDKNDVNVSERAGDKTDISISVCFCNLPATIIIDATNETTLQDEHLLNKDGLLEITKRFPNGGSPKISICAMHPTNPDCCDLLSKKDSDLKKLIKAKSIPCDDYARNASMRTAIWQYYAEDLRIEPVEIDVTKGDTKSIWDKLQKSLPLYSLFQSDRKNSDTDSEVQDPLREAVKEILCDEALRSTLDEVAATVETKLQDVASRTLEKLREMNPDVANTLSPIIFTDQQPEHVLVNGIIADFYAASSDSESNNLLWIDTEAGVFCAIDSNLSKDVILHIAESIYLVTITN